MGFRYNGRVHRLAVLVVTAGCGFNVVAGETPPRVDASIDGVPATCQTAGDHACDGRARLECGPDGEWLPDPEICAFACAAGECAGASNVPTTDVATCDATAPRLAPTSGALTLTAPAGQIKVTCSAGCGDGLTEVTATRIAGAPGLGWFCLRALELPASVKLTIPASGGPAEAIAFVVDGPVTIDGVIDVSGKPATMGAAGEGAPGAGDGGGPAGDNGDPGHPGAGPGGGSGGAVTGGVNDFAAGGGGGGGFATSAAAGGGGRSPNGGTAAGGAGGPAAGGPDLALLIGGGGGGGGGDGSCGAACGWAGGGGGGAIQISSRASISIGGELRARGGDGYGIAGSGGGAGGGGAGGAFLLEAPAIAVNGTIVVDGGDGGAAGGAGGAGASGANTAAPGATATGNRQGGAGGGGAGGRVRIRAVTPSCGAAVSPAASCTTGAL